MLFLTVVFAVVAFASHGEGAPNFPKGMLGRNVPDGRIVGGRDAYIEELPYQASLQWNGRHICGAVIISPDYALTAAHCTDGSSASQLNVRVGSSNHNSGGYVISVGTLYQHPEFDGYDLDFDISVLRLSGPLPLGPNINSIGLPTSEVLSNTSVVVSGWGVLREGGGALAAQLQAVDVNIISNAECQRAYSNEYISSRMLCAGVPGGGRDACQGDSGGPLVANGNVYGVVSWGYGCARASHPGVYASVYGLRSYVREVTGL